MASTDKMVRAKELRAKLESQLSAIVETVNSAAGEKIVLGFQVAQEPGGPLRVIRVTASVEVE